MNLRHVGSHYRPIFTICHHHDLPKLVNNYLTVFQLHQRGRVQRPRREIS